MEVDFSKTSDGDNILKLKPETKFEERVLLGMGSQGNWKMYFDADINMVITDEHTELKR